MAPRATAFAKRPTSGRAAERARSMTEPLGEPVPLPIAELLEPYRRNRGLSIRVERLAHGAKLSAGRNNGDRSYSLMPDDLVGLEYLPASASYEAHTLAVRIVSVEGGDGETLAVIDLPITAHAAANDTAPGASALAAAASNVEAQSAREELTHAKASLAAREMELAATRKLFEEAERSRKALEQEFAAAETAWEGELRRRLSEAAVEASAALEKSRLAIQAENAARALKSETSAQAAGKAVEEARKRWEAEAQTAIAKAQADWKASETVRLAAAEARWRDQSGAALAEWRTKAERAEAALAEAQKNSAANTNVVASSKDAELKQLCEQIATVQATLATTQSNLATRTAELAEARAVADSLRSRAQRTSTEVAKAEEAWKAAEAERFAAAEARWKEQTDKLAAESTARLQQIESALAEARAQAEAQLHQLNSVQASLAARDREVAELRAASGRVEQIESALAEARAQAEARLAQLDAVQGSLVARDQELAQLRSAAEELRTRAGMEAEIARARWQHEMESALAQAQETWKAGEAARLAAAETQWKAQFAPALAGSTAELQHAQSTLAQARAEAQAQVAQADEELRRLRDELAAAQTALVARQSELAEARSAAESARAIADQGLNNVAAEIEKARQKWQTEAEAALAKAEQAWRAEEAPRLAAAEAQWQEAIALRLTQAEERFHRTESALADSRACSEALRHELAAAQNSLANREIELAEARATLEQERERWNQSPAAAMPQPVRKPKWEDDEEERRATFRRRLIRDVAVVACLAGVAFMAFPHVQPVVAQAWPQSMSIKSNFQPLLQMAGLAAPPPPPPEAPEPHALVDVRVANLRENPSTGAAVVSKLARNVEVTPVEHRGEWVFVRVGEGPTQRQGWIANSVLKDAGEKTAAHE